VLTQEQFAELVGVSVDFLSLIERGINAPSFEVLERMREGSGCRYGSCSISAEAPRQHWGQTVQRVVLKALDAWLSGPGEGAMDV